MAHTDKEMDLVKAIRSITKPLLGDKPDSPEAEEAAYSYLARALAQGTFSRQLFLGESADGEHITATYENGVLTATIPVAEEAKPRKVEITHVGGELPALTANTVAA